MYSTEPRRPLPPTRPAPDVARASRAAAPRPLSSLAALALVVVLILAGCTSQITSASSTSTMPLPNQLEVPASPKTGINATVLVKDVTLQAGETLRVTDQIEISLQPSTNVEVDNNLVCQPLDKSLPNNLGASTTTGTNYYSGNTLQWNVSQLLQDQTGQEATYDCYVLISSDPGTYHMLVLPPTNGQTADGTWLQVGASDEVGAHLWWYSPLYCMSNDTAGSPGECTYVGGSNAFPATDVPFPPPNPTLPPTPGVWMAADD
ncbi:MAG: hypothetical protein ACLQUY_14550, partial [Ktedonobacterales bacterium]